MKKLARWGIVLAALLCSSTTQADDYLVTTIYAVEAYGSGRVSITFNTELGCGLATSTAEMRISHAASEEVLSRIQHLATAALLSGRTVRVKTDGASGSVCKLAKLQLR